MNKEREDKAIITAFNELWALKDKVRVHEENVKAFVEKYQIN